MSQTLFSLQGYIRIGERLPNGQPGALHWVGNVPEASIALEQESTTKNESFSGQRLPYGRLNTARSGRIEMTLDEWSTKNMAMGLYAQELAVSADDTSGETFPEGLIVGDQVRLAHPYASNLVIVDSDGSPETLTAGTHYRVIGHNDSIVEILDLDTFTQPLVAAYDYDAYEELDVFTEAAQDRYVIFDGINTETGAAVIMDLYRVSFDPFSNLGLIHAEYGQLPMTGEILFDPLNVDAQGRGGFYRLRQKA